MPKPPVNKPPTSAPKPRGIDWSVYGARSADDGDRIVWRPSTEGDVVTGTVGRVDEAQTRYGAKVLIELDDCRSVVAGGTEEADGAYTLWPTPGLINAFADATVDKGDRVLISLDELIDTGKGNPFKRFSVSVLDPSDEPF